MADDTGTRISSYLVTKGRPPLTPAEVAEVTALLRDTPPGWDFRHAGTAIRNPAFVLTAIGLVVTILLVYFLGYQAVAASLAGKEVATALVAAWLIAPPIFFFVELYFRGQTKDARDQIKDYQEAALRIWLAVAAVLGGLYGLSFT